MTPRSIMRTILAALLASAFLYIGAPTPAGAQVVTNNGTVTAAVPKLTTNLSPGQSNCAVAVTGTWTGTLTFQLSNDGTTYFTSPTDTVTTATANGLFFVTCASVKFFQVSGASVTGTANIAFVGTPASAPKGGGGASSAVNLTQVNSTPIGSATVPGTSVTALVPILGVQGATGGVPLPVSGTVTITPSGTQTVTGTVNATPPLTGISGTGTAQGVNQSVVTSCDFNTTLPTLTTGNVGPNQCDTNGRQIVVGAGTAGTSTGGVVSVQGIAAGTNINVAQATAANLNATVTQATAANLNVTAQGNIANFAGSATTTALGLPSQRLFPSNTSGGGCNGVNLTTGTQITKQFTFLSFSSATTTQIVPLSAGKIIHVCNINVSATALTVTIDSFFFQYGTGANCVTGTTNLWAFTTTSSSLNNFSIGNGESSIIETASSNALCIATPTFSAGTIIANITYAVY